MSRHLSRAQGDKVFQLALGVLSTTRLRAPAKGQREASYTAIELRPHLEALVDELNINGLRVAGDGGGPVRPVYLFGLQFFPDLTLAFFDEQLAALEVKFLRAAQRQHQLVTATGQASFYKRVGYERVGVVLIDLDNRLSDEDIEGAAELMRSRTEPLSLIVRRRRGQTLEPHPSHDASPQ